MHTGFGLGRFGLGRFTLGRLRAAALVFTVAASTCAGIAGAPGSNATTPAAAASVASIASVATLTSSAEHGGTPAKTVTLITGDKVSVQRLAGGRQAATVEPGPGRDGVAFQQLEVDGDLHVFPVDAVPYLDADLLDPDLFNITRLLAQHYDDANRPTMPLILGYRPGHSPGSARARNMVEAASAGPVLESINARAYAADKSAGEGFWESVDDDAFTAAGPARDEARAPARPVLAGGIDHIWLDQTVRATLDRSVPQIGAPEAWEAGFDGTGVTVAVLDTGVDANHPDLAGVVTESRNFTASPTATDRFGHGTHVAATVAGSGAAAGGRRGVAPGARLLSGKVLDDNGSGLTSWILAGMEWATHSGAKVVNMSLGGGPTDGTDPLSQGVDALTEQTGTLFVISAGNSGDDGEFTVGTPGAANSALTVGAVDRDESLAPFSSRGPRVGDFAVKPDITAPGVGIVAARAAGTNLGTPVGDHHTTLSGTSMAAPHVAGAAAILAQKYTDWTPLQLKDALAGSGVRNNDLTVFEQGGGRVDVPRALQQGVHGTGTLDLGVYEDGGEPAEVRKDVTYANHTDAPVTLDLDLALRGPGGDASAGIRLDRTQVEVAAGGTATVRVVVDPADVALGRHAGYLVATAPGGIAVHTSLGLMKESPRHRITLNAVGPDGEPVFVNPVMLFGTDRRFDVIGYIVPGGSRTYEVAEGTYYLNAMITHGDSPDEEVFQVVDPVVEVDRDLTVTVDAQKAKEVVIRTPTPAKQDGILSFYAHREFANRTISNYVMKFDTTRRLYVTPTERVADEAFEFGSRWSMIAPPLTSRVVTPKQGPSLELFYLRHSPALTGHRTYDVVDVGAGLPADYTGRDVDGKIAVVSTRDWRYEDRVADAAAAGAAMAAIIVEPGSSPWSKLNLADGERLPAMGALLSRAQGAELLELLDRGRVRLELTGVPVSPYLYDVLQISRGQVPSQVVHTVNHHNSATVATTYHESGGAPWSKEQRFGWRPWQTTAINQYQRYVRTPFTRLEVVSAGDTLWQHRVKHRYSWENLNPLAGGMTQAPRTYDAGSWVHERWFAPLVRPAIPRGVPGLTSYREGDTLRIRVPEFVDNGMSHYGFAEGDVGIEPDQGSAALYRDGELLADGEWAWGDFPAEASGAASTAGGEADYRLDLSVTRTGVDWQYATRTDTSWTFRSGRPPAGKQALLPLLQVDYDVKIDGDNSVRAGRSQEIDLTVRHQDGLPKPGHPRVTVWMSYDDGHSWDRVDQVRGKGDGRFEARVHLPKLHHTNGYVTLRVRAEDDDGNSVTQEVLRAYGLS